MDKKIKTEQNIIKAAKEVFSVYGYKKTSMDDIANSANMGKSTLYYYFKDKESIFDRVVNLESKVLKEDIMNFVDKEDDPKSKLSCYVKKRFQMTDRLFNYYSIIKKEYYSHYDFIEKIREKHLQEEVNIITDILKSGVKENLFVIKNIEITAYTIITTMKGLEHSWSTKGKSFKSDEIIDSLLDLMFNGIGLVTDSKK